MIIWNLRVKNFCEGIDAGPPEYLNALSSLVICVYGMLGLWAPKNNNLLFKIISSAIILTGIGSFGYHWTLVVGWKNLDEIPMLMGSCMGSLLFVDIILRKIYHVHKYQDNKRYHAIISSITLIYVAYLIVSCIVIINDNANGVTFWLFPFLFGAPLIVILFSSLIMRYITHRQELYEPQTQYAFNMLFFGIKMTIFFAILDQTIENTCPSYRWMRLFATHALWHIGMANGLYVIGNFLMFMYVDNDIFKAEFRNIDTNNRYFNKFIKTFIPIVDYRLVD
jgi:hypothetical protein